MRKFPFFNESNSDLGTGGEPQPNPGETTSTDLNPDGSSSNEPPIVETKSPFDNLGTSDDLDAFIESAAKTDKQAYSSGAETPEGTDPDAIKPPGDDKPLKVSAQSEAGAKMVVHTFDMAFSKAAQFITEAESRKKYAADEEEFKDLIDAWALYIESVGMKIPPWLGMALLMFTVYGLRIPAIIKDRKKLMLEKKEAAIAAENRKAREEAIRRASTENKEPGAPETTIEEKEAIHTDNSGRQTRIKVEEVITKCIECGKPLTPLQIHRKGRFCCKSHSSQHTNRLQKLNPNQ